MMTRHTFDVLAERRVIGIECDDCGEPRRRTLKAFQTLNPYNRNPDGSAKSTFDIRRELPAELDRLERDLRKRGIVCKACQKVRDELGAP